jgi:hypothetical protein
MVEGEMRRLIRLAPAAILILDWMSAQSGASGSAANAIYFLRDKAHKQWCGYAEESRLVQRLRAMVTAKVVYTSGHVSAVYLTEEDETGDWMVCMTSMPSTPMRKSGRSKGRST